jgi:hypothetical protein
LNGLGPIKNQSKSVILERGKELMEKKYGIDVNY